MASRLTPPSSGRPGPGEMSTASGRAARMPATSMASLRNTTGLGPELTQLLDQVVDEGVVVVDDEHPGSHGRDDRTRPCPEPPAGGG